MIANTTELFGVVKEISLELKKADEQELSDGLEDALTISVVPHEILGETRLKLKELRSKKIARELGIKSKIDEALKYIKKAW